MLKKIMKKMQKYATEKHFSKELRLTSTVAENQMEKYYIAFLQFTLNLSVLLQRMNSGLLERILLNIYLV